MIEELSLTYTMPTSNVTFTVRCTLDDDNAPYTLADICAELIRKSSVNEEIVIGQLIDEFNYKQDEQT